MCVGTKEGFFFTASPEIRRFPTTPAILLTTLITLQPKFAGTDLPHELLEEIFSHLFPSDNKGSFRKSSVTKL